MGIRLTDLNQPIAERRFTVFDARRPRHANPWNDTSIFRNDVLPRDKGNMGERLVAVTVSDNIPKFDEGMTVPIRFKSETAQFLEP